LVRRLSRMAPRKGWVAAWESRATAERIRRTMRFSGKAEEE
jgi:hypothetical protein